MLDNENGLYFNDLLSPCMNYLLVRRGSDWKPPDLPGLVFSTPGSRADALPSLLLQ